MDVPDSLLSTDLPVSRYLCKFGQRFRRFVHECRTGNCFCFINSDYLFHVQVGYAHLVGEKLRNCSSVN